MLCKRPFDEGMTPHHEKSIGICFRGDDRIGFADAVPMTDEPARIYHTRNSSLYQQLVALKPYPVACYRVFKATILSRKQRHMKVASDLL